MKSTIEVEPLEFIVKRRTRVVCGRSDVSINVLPSTEKYKTNRCNITFRNNISDVISSTGYIKFAVKKNRMYFAEASDFEGYKLTRAGDSNNNRYVKIVEEKMEPFAGNYDVRFDDFHELYYIERQ